MKDTAIILADAMDACGLGIPLASSRHVIDLLTKKGFVLRTAAPEEADFCQPWEAPSPEERGNPGWQALYNVVVQAKPDHPKRAEAWVTDLWRKGVRAAWAPHRPDPTLEQSAMIVALDNAERIDKLEARLNGLGLVEQMRAKGLIP